MDLLAARLAASEACSCVLHRPGPPACTKAFNFTLIWMPRVQGLRLALGSPAEHVPGIHCAAIAATTGAPSAPTHRSRCSSVCHSAATSAFARNQYIRLRSGELLLSRWSSCDGHWWQTHASVVSNTLHTQARVSDRRRGADAEHGPAVAVRASAHAVPAEVPDAAGGAQGAAYDGRALHVSMRAQRGRVGGGGERVAGTGRNYGCELRWSCRIQR